MKIGLITTHFLKNYGSILQAYGLKKKLEDLGHEVTIINYIPEVMARNTKVNLIKLRFGMLLRYGVSFAFKRKKRGKNFSDFKNENFVINNRIVGYKNLKTQNFNFDAYVCGSDQIWNPKLYGGLNDGFFLKFTNSSRKISYAPSIRIRALDEFEKEYFKGALKDFKAISVRESSSVDLLQPLTEKKVRHVVDPTLLLEKEDWNKIASKVKGEKGKFGLVYETHANSELEISVKRLKKEMKMPFYNISTNIHRIPGASNKLGYIGPSQFIKSIKDSKFVITNSFHCCVFCLIYKTPFVVFSHKNDDRFISILKPLGLENRIVDKESEIDEKMYVLNESNSTLIDKVFNEMREESIEFLKEALENNYD